MEVLECALAFESQNKKNSIKFSLSFGIVKVVMILALFLATSIGVYSGEKNPFLLLFISYASLSICSNFCCSCLIKSLPVISFFEISYLQKLHFIEVFGIGEPQLGQSILGVFFFCSKLYSSPSIIISSSSVSCPIVFALLCMMLLSLSVIIPSFSAISSSFCKSGCNIT